MIDRLGNSIFIDDICVCYNIMGTGSSTKRLVQYVGKIVGFTKTSVKVECVSCFYTYNIGKIFYCSYDNIFRLRDWREDQ